MTRENLGASLAGESQAHIKYLAFAAQAEKEGKPNIARLFQATSYAEQVHALNHLRELGGIGDTRANLGKGFDGEMYEVEHMYPPYVAAAEAQGEKGAQRSMNYALEAEKLHAVLYANALKAAEAGQDILADAIYVCPICGFTHQGEPPERCPICGTKQERFKAF